MSKLSTRAKRKDRIRRKVAGTPDRPRLTVYKSAQHIYAQVIDDTVGRTVAHASTLELKGPSAGAAASKKKSDLAKWVGTQIAEKSKASKVTKVVFDRNGYPYHGRVAALADAAREAGLQF